MIVEGGWTVISIGRIFIGSPVLGLPGCTIVDPEKRNDAANALPNRIGAVQFVSIIAQLSF